MNAAHLHIILVHFPIVLLPTATILLAFALLRRQGTVATVALSLFVGASLCSIPAFLLGEEAAEIIEHLPGISEDTIEEHEEAADIAFWLTLFVGGIAASSILLGKRAPRVARGTLILLVVAGAVASASLAYTAYEGGKIRHPEAYDTPASSDQAGQRDDSDD
jgi:uncharacterized membrane protein